MTTSINDVQNNVQTYWSPIFTDELRESLMLGSLVSKQYEGSITKGGDKVKVTQIIAATGELLTVGTNADVFGSEKVQTSQIEIQANKRAVASYEFDDLVSLQSQIDAEDGKVRASLIYAMERQINDYLFSLVNPYSSSPDHVINSTATFSKTTLVTARKLAGAAKWLKNQGWYGLLDAEYYGDVLADTDLNSAEKGATDAPSIGGQVSLPRFGFNLLEDNSRDSKYALLFHPDFLHMVSQTSVQIKISDMHSQGRFGVKMSVDLVFGAALGIDGRAKHIKVIST